MGMREWPSWECVVPVDAVKRAAKEEYDTLESILEMYGVSWCGVGHMGRYDEVEVLDDYIEMVDDDIEISKAREDIVKAVEAVERKFKERTNIHIYATQTSQDIAEPVEFMWGTPLKMARKLEDIGANIVAWTEWG
jgi:hypothetical protein